MNDKKKLLAISGSTRSESSNLNLIKAIVPLVEDRFSITVFEGLAELPHFNPDLDQARPPKQISNFRLQLRGADAVLICTPEYAMGVPGTLKNAIDWTVSSMEFSQKPVGLITASVAGEKAHASLLETLHIIDAEMTTNTQLLISFIQTKLDGPVFKDDLVKQDVCNLLQSLHALTIKQMN